MIASRHGNRREPSRCGNVIRKKNERNIRKTESGEKGSPAMCTVFAVYGVQRKKRDIKINVQS